MNLFPEPEPIELSPAQLARVAAKRAAWSRRQRLCRARRKMTSAEKLAERSQIAAALRARESAQLVLGDDADLELSTLGHELFFLRAMQLGGLIARQIFERLRPDDFTQATHQMVFAAAAAIHARGYVVSIAGIHAQLKRDGVVLGDVSCYALDAMPLGNVTPDAVENRAAQLKAA